MRAGVEYNTTENAVINTKINIAMFYYLKIVISVI